MALTALGDAAETTEVWPFSESEGIAAPRNPVWRVWCYLGNLSSVKELYDRHRAILADSVISQTEFDALDRVRAAIRDILTALVNNESADAMIAELQRHMTGQKGNSE